MDVVGGSKQAKLREGEQRGVRPAPRPRAAAAGPTRGGEASAPVANGCPGVLTSTPHDARLACVIAVAFGSSDKADAASIPQHADAAWL